MSEDPADVARDLVTHRFPHARWAVLSGSVLTARRTPGSDLDIVVRLGAEDTDVAHRESVHWRGFPAELFAHDDDSLRRHLERELTERRPVLRRMIATGVPVVDRDGGFGEIAARCRAEFAAGPPPVTTPRRDRIRYALTDLLDDAAHAPADERTVIAATAWRGAAEALLDVRRHWRGNGKWLLRELSACDRDLAERWVAAHGDAKASLAFARDVLAEAGGPLFAGYRVDAP